MRQPTPWFRAAKNAWFVEHGGRQCRLGRHPDGAPPPRRTKTGWNAPLEIREAFHALMSGQPDPRPKAENLPAVKVCDLFLDHSQKHHAPGTFAGYKFFLKSFCGRHGRQPAKAVVPFHVNSWLDSKPTWKGSRRHAALAVKRAFAWADKQGLLSPSPLKGLEVEAGNRRTRVLTRDEQAAILAEIKDRPFREFVTALLATGCRPSEVARVTAADVNLDLGVWVLATHKTFKKTGKPRVIYLTPEMLELTRRLMAEFPEGPLFRGPRGKKPYSRNGIRCRFKRLRAKLPHLPPFVCYNLRHTFATQALVNGVGVAQVAELLGHTSTEMVSSTYGHLAGEVAHLREAARRAAS